MANKDVFITNGVQNPDIPTSAHDLSHYNRLTAKIGKIYPALVIEAPAKSTYHIQPKMAFDTLPFKFPIQTNIRAHLKLFRVPMRILCDKFEDFVSQIGSDGLPINQSASPIRMPFIARTDWVKQGSLADYMGLPTNKITSEVILANTPTRGARRVSTYEYGSIRGSHEGNMVILSMLSCDNFSDIVTHSSGGTTSTMSITILSRHDDPFDDNIQLRYFIPTTEFVNHFYDESAHYRTDSPFYGVTSLVNGTHYTDEVTQKEANNISYYSHKLTFTLPDTIVEQVTSRLRNGSHVCLEFTPSDADAFYMFSLLGDNFGSVSTIGINTADIVKDDNFDSLIAAFRNGVAQFGDVWTTRAVMTASNVFDGANPKIPINALPFRAYEFCYNYFMRNVQIDPFIKDNVPTYNKFLTTTSDGADTTPYHLFNAPYEYDYFTTCLKTPQFGNAPLVGVTVNNTNTEGTFTFKENNVDHEVKVKISDDGDVLPITNYEDSADAPYIKRLNEVINFGISINDIRNVSVYQRALERLQRTSYRFENVIYEFFGTNPPVGENYPRYIGGHTELLTPYKIQNTAKSSDYALGEFAGTGAIRGNGETIVCHCNEPCYILGLLYFTPTPSYPQMLPKHFTKFEPLDYLLNPDFQSIGAQPVFKRELAPLQLSDEELSDVFGYNRPYAEYISMQDEVHGEFRGSMSDFIMQRLFGSAPALNKSFVEVDQEELTNIFSVTSNDDKIFGEIYFDIKATLPLLRHYQARLI